MEDSRDRELQPCILEEEISNKPVQEENDKHGQDQGNGQPDLVPDVQEEEVEGVGETGKDSRRKEPDQDVSELEFFLEMPKISSVPLLASILSQILIGIIESSKTRTDRDYSQRDRQEEEIHQHDRIDIPDQDIDVGPKGAVPFEAKPCMEERLLLLFLFHQKLSGMLLL